MDSIIDISSSLFDYTNFCESNNYDPFKHLCQSVYQLILDQLILQPTNDSSFDYTSATKCLFVIGLKLPVICLLPIEGLELGPKPKTIDQWFDLALNNHFHELPTEWICDRNNFSVENIFNLPFNLFALLCGVFYMLNKIKHARKRNYLLDEVCCALLFDGAFSPADTIKEKLRLLVNRPEIAIKYCDLFQRGRIINSCFIKFIYQINKSEFVCSSLTMHNNQNRLKLKRCKMLDFDDFHILKDYKDLEAKRITKAAETVQVTKPEMVVCKPAKNNKRLANINNTNDNPLVDPIENLLRNCNERRPPSIDKINLLPKTKLIKRCRRTVVKKL